MLTQDGPKVLECDVRFGDPEAQTLLPLIGTKSDLAEIMLACVEQRVLDSHKRFKDEHQFISRWHETC
jgi:phosphoribosylamine-glycine ligase